MSNPPTLTASYRSPLLSADKTPHIFLQELPPPPSHTVNSRTNDHHVEPLHKEPDIQSKVHHLRYLRQAVVAMQSDVNVYLTTMMKEEKQAGIGNDDGKEEELEEDEEMDEETKKLEAEVEKARREEEEERRSSKAQAKIRREKKVLEKGGRTG